MNQTNDKNPKSEANQITEGVIWKQLMLFFFPIVVGTFFQQLYNTVDAIVVGQVAGTNALASVGGSAGQIINLVVGFFTGLTAGATVMISQFFGAKKEDMVNRSLHCAYAFAIFGGAVISVIGIILTPSFLEWMKTSPDVIADSTVYLRIYFSGIIFVFIYNMGSSILRSTGDSKRPLYYLIICCFINIFLDILLVVVFRLAVAGVAIATWISQAISAILVTRCLMRSEHGLKLTLSKIRIAPDILKGQLKIGLPGGFQSCMYNISNVLIQACINSFGTATVAAATAYAKMDSIYWMISGAFGISITTFVGQNYGAKKQDRVRKSVQICFAMNCLIALLISALMLAFCVPLLRIFTSDAEVIDIGQRMVHVVSPFYITFVTIEILSGALRGMGNVVIPTILTMSGVCIFRIIWIIVAVPHYTDFSGVYISYPISWILTSILFLFYYTYSIHHMKKRGH